MKIKLKTPLKTIEGETLETLEMADLTADHFWAFGPIYTLTDGAARLKPGAVAAYVGKVTGLNPVELGRLALADYQKVEGHVVTQLAHGRCKPGEPYKLSAPVSDGSKSVESVTPRELSVSDYMRLGEASGWTDQGGRDIPSVVRAYIGASCDLSEEAVRQLALADLLVLRGAVTDFFMQTT